MRDPLDSAIEAGEMDIDVRDSRLPRFLGGKKDAMKVIRDVAMDAIQNARERSANRANLTRIGTDFRERSDRT